MIVQTTTKIVCKKRFSHIKLSGEKLEFEDDSN